ncbi:MAG TPA: trypsin-like peptidase domain-containing protein [Gemmatimonadales bacterium]|nr:trypsin-like peptidase domain-containing protein [Gemmatimonadales bacterium]
MTSGVRLRRLDGRHAGHVHPLTRDVTTVGSHPASDLQVDGDQSPGIAPRHAALINASTGWVVRHLEGQAGTWVNGARIRRERQLNPGDTLQFGEHGPAFRFEADNLAPAAGLTPQTQTARRALLLLGLGLAMAAGWFALRGSGDRSDGNRESLLARVDSLATVLRAAEARESTLATRLAEAVTEVAETRALLANPDSDVTSLDAIARRIDRMGAAQGGLLRAAEFDVTTVVAAHRDAVALLLVEHEDRSLVSGTAVAVHRSGDTSWVATSRHLVVDSTARGARRLGLAFDGTAQVFEALLIGSDLEHDLALLRVVIRGGTPVIPGTAAPPPPGAPVAVITFPLGLDLAAAGDWRVSGVTASAFTATVTQATGQRLVLDGYGSPGMSGSPVLNAEGEIVGIVFGGAPDAGNRVVFAVPGGALRSLLAQVGLR